MAASRKPVGETLDASWDRQLATGRVAPERTVDLHGHGLANAHMRLERALGEAVRDGVRVLLVIAGRAPATGASRLDAPLRGVIRASIRDWLAASQFAGDIAAIRGAHRRHGGAGAIYLVIRRRSSIRS